MPQYKEKEKPKCRKRQSWVMMFPNMQISCGIFQKCNFNAIPPYTMP
jgi:hypothetical protein